MSKTSTVEWISVKDRLPAITRFLVSDPLLFVTEGRTFSGHYHENGWFYSDSRGEKMVMAYGRIDRVTVESGKYQYPPPATYWAKLPTPTEGE